LKIELRNPAMMMDTHSSDQQLTFSNPLGPDPEMLDILLRKTFDYFMNEINPENGLISDKNQPGWPSSITAVGLGLSTYVVAAERGLISRSEAIKKTLAMLRYFYAGHQGTEKDAMGYKGFYYHFLDMQTGRRAWLCELSTIDTTFFIAGVLVASCYFTGESNDETEIRELAEKLYNRIDWQWALNGGATICHGWKPESGFLPYRWDYGYSEAILLYILAVGSPTHPIADKGYQEWTSTFELKKVGKTKYIYAGPLFIHQLSHIWLDFRGIHDDLNRKTGIDYFENSRRATYIHQRYAIANPHNFSHYSKYNWGFTASDGPGPAYLKIKGIDRVFYDYIARGAPFGPDDGTISPWAVVASLPFAPEIVLSTLRHAIEKLTARNKGERGFDASFNPAYVNNENNSHGWVSPWKFGLNEGPIILMIENFQSELIWKLIKLCPHIVNGLRRAGFRDGWLNK
jgi:hypothetical protein